MRRRPVAPKHNLAVCGSGERTRVAPPESFHGRESPLTRDDAARIGASDRFLCDTAEARVADVHWCGIRAGATGSHPMGQTAQPAVVAGMVDPGGSTSGTDHAIAPEISFALTPFFDLHAS